MSRQERRRGPRTDVNLNVGIEITEIIVKDGIVRLCVVLRQARRHMAFDVTSKVTMSLSVVAITDTTTVFEHKVLNIVPCGTHQR